MGRIVLGWVILLAAPLVVRGDVKLPPILSSHMVLQRDLPVPIWGTAQAGEKVTVKFRDQTKTAEADKEGKWLVRLDALKAGGPDTLTVNGANTVTLDDVLVGEVWIGSGQSNMDGRVNGYAKNDPGLVKLMEGTPYPQVRLARATGGWKVADKENANAFSALLLPFGVRLQQELGVPVGLMLGAVGGTPSGAWLSEEMFKADALCQEQVKKAAATYDADKAKAAYAAALKKWEEAVEKAKADGKPAPGKPAPPLAPGEIRGGRFGYLYAPHIQPMAPFAIRGVLWDQGESGTAVEAADQFAVMGALIRGWRKAWGQDFAFLSVQKPSGGGPAFDPADPVTDKADKFAPLPATVPTVDNKYRELHLNLRQHPNTFLVIASDLGSGIHPSNKSGYGYRSARVALGGVYGKKVEIYGPTYQSHKIDGDRVVVSFSHVGGGLVFKQGDKLQGFAVAGADNKFHWANAVIEGETVVLTCPQVSKPVSVRYAWAPTHPWANLFNRDGLPALPFKTDN
jgi:sialate O-acetylesterase